MRFVGEAAGVCKFISDRRSVTGFTVVRCQVDVVRVVLQTSSPLFSFFTVAKRLSFLQVGTVSCTISTNDTKAFVFVADRTANTVAVRTACSVTLVFTQVLNSEVQAINQTKEVGVTIGSNAATPVPE